MTNLPPTSGKLTRPGAALKAARSEKGLTLADVSVRTGLQASTLSKIENGKAELTVDKLLRISLALDLNIADLFVAPTGQHAPAKTSSIRSITRAGEGKAVDSTNGRVLYQAYDVLSKSLTPTISEVSARSLQEFGAFHRHPGEEFVYVLDGELGFYTDTYTPSYLKAGDSIYFDSGMGHAYVSVGEGPCRIISVFLTSEHETVGLMEQSASELIDTGTPEAVGG